MIYRVETCGKCIIWERRAEQPALLNAPRLGRCRLLPPQVNFVPVQTPRGMEMQQNMSYPTLPDDFPACASFTTGQDNAG